MIVTFRAKVGHQQQTVTGGDKYDQCRDEIAGVYREGSALESNRRPAAEIRG